GLRSAQTAARAAVAEQSSVLDSVNGDLAQLVAAETARREAALEAKTRLALAKSLGRQGNGRHKGKVPAGDARRASIAIAAAEREVGKAYHWGAAGPSSFDCSGLTMWAWRAAGVHLAHYTGAQYAATRHIPLAELQPGDLVFFYGDVSHVGLYVGGGRMID